MSGSEIAAEIDAALREAGAEVGGGTLICTLRKRENIGTPVEPFHEENDYDVPMVKKTKSARYQDRETMEQKTTTILLSAVAGVEPAPGDQVFPGMPKSEVASVPEEELPKLRYEVGKVKPLSPGGVPLMYEVDIAQGYS